jgi:hypothetical protein
MAACVQTAPKGEMGQETPRPPFTEVREPAALPSTHAWPGSVPLPPLWGRGPILTVRLRRQAAGIGSPSAGGRGHRAAVPVKRGTAAGRYLPLRILLRNRLQ